MINIYPDIMASPWVGWIAAAGLIAAALTAFIKFVPPAWRALVKFTATVNSLTDLPQFMVTTAATLAAQNEQLAVIHHEVNYNNGSSVKDAIGRVEKGVAGLYVRADATDKAAADLRVDLEAPRPVVRKRTPKSHT